jgi:hypothetical protein
MKGFFLRNNHLWSGGRSVSASCSTCTCGVQVYTSKEVAVLHSWASHTSGRLTADGLLDLACQGLLHVVHSSALHQKEKSTEDTSVAQCQASRLKVWVLQQCPAPERKISRGHIGSTVPSIKTQGMGPTAVSSRLSPSGFLGIALPMACSFGASFCWVYVYHRQCEVSICCLCSKAVHLKCEQGYWSVLDCVCIDFHGLLPVVRD